MIYESLSVDMDFDVNYLQTSLGLPPVQGPATNTYSLSWTSPNDPTVVLELVPSLEETAQLVLLISMSYRMVTLS